MEGCADTMALWTLAGAAGVRDNLLFIIIVRTVKFRARLAVISYRNGAIKMAVIGMHMEEDRLAVR